MKVKTIASGSKGNCSIVLCNNTNIIIDMGISYLTLKRSLEENSLSFEQFSGILITHSHKDHINGLKSLIKHTNLVVYIPEKMYPDLEEIVPPHRCKFIEDKFEIQDVEVELIHTSHDAPCSVGYIISFDNKSLVYVTDTGYINRKYLAKMVNMDIYVIEANHDEIMLMDGPYPRFLKERVISDKGHLSNKTTAKYLKKIIGKNTKCIILAHLSEKNNTEEKALEAVREELDNNSINVIVARQKEESPMIEV
ncbi:MAG: MBL fold metallo-hydrolase [Candidatus Faecimonas sp.]|nr:MBL fold metallo-hydrolase [Candidatus Faecimonas sp.]